MGKIIKNSAGKVLTASGGAFEVTAAIDSNITAGNIKKDVTILGVTGTYEGSGGGGSVEVSIIGNVASPEKMYYVTPEGEVTLYSGSVSRQITCLDGSLIVWFRGAAEPGPNPDEDELQVINATLIESVSLGNRASYRYADIYQVTPEQ